MGYTRGCIMSSSNRFTVSMTGVDVFTINDSTNTIGKWDT